MTAFHIAQLNIGRPRGEVASAVMAGFTTRVDPVNALADRAPGFVWRLEGDDGPGATSLRPCGPDIMVNLSVWQTLAELRDFTYRLGPHLDMLRQRRRWFVPLGQPHLVLWWIPAGRLPSIEEALDRLERLRRDGPGPLAFTFREPYDPPRLSPAGAGPVEASPVEASTVDAGSVDAGDAVLRADRAALRAAAGKGH